MKNGDLIIFPTDTVYGLGCQVLDLEGIENIYKLKKRPKSKPIPILVSDIVSLNPICEIDKRALKLMTKFWPGPLTLILKTKKEFKKITGETTIAVRIPDHYMAQQVIKEYGPLRVTSANISGNKPLNTLEDVKIAFGSKVFKIYGEYTSDSSGVPSTIVDLTNKEIKILRQGNILEKDILDTLK